MGGCGECGSRLCEWCGCKKGVLCVWCEVLVVYELGWVGECECVVD